jgi:hypothetical protein
MKQERVDISHLPKIMGEKISMKKLLEKLK